MAAKTGARLHMEHLKITNGEGLKPGDVVSLLPYLWQYIGVVCKDNVRSYILFLNQQKRQGTIYQNLEPLQNMLQSEFVVIPNCAVIPFLDPDTFNQPNPNEHSIAIIGDKVALMGWINYSYLLFDAATGQAIERSSGRHVYVTSWDLMTKDIDDDIVSLLEVRP